MPRVRKTVSPLVAIMVTSARTWAMSGLTGGPGSPTCRPAAPTADPPGRLGDRRARLHVGAAVSPPGPGDGQVGLLQGTAGAEIAEGQVVGRPTTRPERR